MLLGIFLISDDVKAEAAAVDAEISPEKVMSLINSAKEGDSSAFSELVECYGRFVYNTACRVLSTSMQSLDQADDIAQEAFVKAWRSIRSFRGDSSFSTWLFRITVNTARDCIRSSMRRPTVSLSRQEGDEELGEWDVPVTSGDTVPEDRLERRETILAVRRAIEALPEDQRTVVIMRDIHDLPYHDIAQRLGLELGTVKSRLNRGRASLKEILKKENVL